MRGAGGTRSLVAAAVVVVLAFVAWTSCAQPTPEAAPPPSPAARPVAPPPSVAPRRREAPPPDELASSPGERAEAAPREKIAVEPVPAQVVSIAGRVVLAGTRRPAEGVAVRAWASPSAERPTEEAGREQRTGADGRFEIAGVPAGSRTTIYAVQAGFRTADWSGTAAPGLDVELVLGDGGVLEGTVYDESGRPMPGVDVFLLQPDRPIPSRDTGSGGTPDGFADLVRFVFPPCVTDELGRYRFVGSRLSTAEKQNPRCAAARDAAGREARSEPATFFATGERQTRDVRYSAPGSVRVVLLNSRDRGVGVVRLEHGDVGVTKELHFGTTTFDGVPAGACTVTLDDIGATRTPWTLTRPDVRVKAGETTLVEFDVGTTAPLAGRVVDDTGAPVVPTRVRFVSAAQSASTGVADDGGFRFGALLVEPGRLRFEDRRGEAWVPGSSWLAATPGGPPVTIVVRRTTTLRGRVAPVPEDRRVTFEAFADGERASHTVGVGEDGSFEYAVPVTGEFVSVVLTANGSVPVVLIDGTMKPGVVMDLGEVKLDGGVTLTTMLRDSEGRALAGAEVEFLDFDLRSRRGTTDAGGRLRVESLPRHRLRLYVRETPTTCAARPVVDDPAAPPAVLTIPAGAFVTGHVVDSSGRPVTAHLSVAFRRKSKDPDSDRKAAQAITETAGAYGIRLEPGSYLVSVDDEERRRPLCDAVDLVLAEGETKTLDLVLR